MIIHYDSHVVRRPKHATAIFCPVCREVVAAGLQEVVRVGRLYGVDVGRGKWLADEVRCSQCQSVFGQHTKFPPPTDHADVLRARVALEAQLAAGTLGPRQREQLIEEPIRSLTYEHQLLITHAPGLSVIRIVAGVGVVAIMLGGFFGYSAGKAPGNSDILFVACCVAGLGIVLGAVAAVCWLITPRSAANQLLPRIGYSIASIQPRPGELEVALANVRREGSQLARILTPQMIERAIEHANAARQQGRV